MAPPKLTDRAEPSVVAHIHRPVRSVRSRLPSVLRIPILVVLNLCINIALWGAVTNFLTPELGAVSKVPNEGDVWSFYSPGARIVMRVFTVWMTWYWAYDFYDVSALIVLINAPYAYLLTTFYEISTLTVAAHVNIEVLSFAIPTYLLRRRSATHDANAALRNRFLLNSIQVQASNALLAMGVYVCVLWVSLRTDYLNIFLVKFFDVLTLEAAHSETPVSIVAKTFTAGVAAKEFLLNPSIAAQPRSGASTPVENFDPATATLPQTVKQNVWNFSKRTRTLIQQTAILNAFLFVNTVQRCMTLNGTEFGGATGYTILWVVANGIIALWYGWVGDTSTAYEPL